MGRRPPAPPPPPDPLPIEDPTVAALAALAARVEKIEALLVETATACRDHLREHAAKEEEASAVYRLPRWV